MVPVSRSTLCRLRMRREAIRRANTRKAMQLVATHIRLPSNPPYTTISTPLGSRTKHPNRLYSAIPIYPRRPQLSILSPSVAKAFPGSKAFPWLDQQAGIVRAHLMNSSAQALASTESSNRYCAIVSSVMAASLTDAGHIIPPVSRAENHRDLDYRQSAKFSPLDSSRSPGS